MWKCQYVSNTEVNCGGHKVTLYGETVTWVNDGNTGKMLKEGQEFYNKIEWKANGDWLKAGNRVMNDSRNLLYYFACIPKKGEHLLGR